MTKQIEEIGIGVSEWRNYGKKHGYYDYFAEEERQKERSKVIETIALCVPDEQESCFCDRFTCAGCGFNQCRKITLKRINKLSQSN